MRILQIPIHPSIVAQVLDIEEWQQKVVAVNIYIGNALEILLEDGRVVTRRLAEVEAVLVAGGVFLEEGRTLVAANVKDNDYVVLLYQMADKVKEDAEESPSAPTPDETDEASIF